MELRLKYSESRRFLGEMCLKTRAGGRGERDAPAGTGYRICSGWSKILVWSACGHWERALYIYTYRGVVLTNENLRRVSNHTETRKQPSASTNGGAPRGPPLDCDKRVVECRPVTAAAAKLPRNGSEMKSRRDSGRQSATWWGGGGPGVAGAEVAFVCFSTDCRIICR